MTALPIPDDQIDTADQDIDVVGEPSQPGPTTAAAPTNYPGLADALLLIFADALDDLERVRIATENRVRSLRQVKGMDGTPEEARLSGLVDALSALEHGAELELKRALRTHPLGPWVKRTIGIGEKQGARLLAAIGDPYWHPVHDRPRTVSELWALCGYHVVNPGGHSRTDTHGRSAAEGSDHVLNPGQRVGDTHAPTAGVDPSRPTDQAPTDAHSGPVGGVAPSRRRGVKANWNATAKMRAYLVAESCIKQRTSPYRAVYDAGRAKYAEAVHPHPCARCGPSGKPAAAGSTLSDGHKHARALRLVAKAVLRDLWIEARGLAS